MVSKKEKKSKKIEVTLELKDENQLTELMDGYALITRILLLNKMPIFSFKRWAAEVLLKECRTIANNYNNALKEAAEKEKKKDTKEEREEK